MTLNASVGYEDVFTVSFDGIYVMTLLTGSAGQTLAVQAPSDSVRDLVFASSEESAGQAYTVYPLAVYLLAGSVVKHKGPAGLLAGVRLGDELSD
jgi:hypothetical protein